MKDLRDSLVVCGALRTPFSFGNALKAYSPESLLELLLREMTARYGVDKKSVRAVLAGCVNQDTRATNIARIAAMRAGFPEETADYSMQANCNSGFICLSSALGELLAGEDGVYLVCGVESMSNYGCRLQDLSGQYGSLYEMEELASRSGKEFLDNFEIVECLNEGLTDSENNMTMLEVAEIMANRFGISREEQETYTRERLIMAVDAVEKGILSRYILPLGELDHDTYPLDRKRLLRKPDSFSRIPLIFGEKNPDLNPKGFYTKHEKHLKRLGIESINPTVTMYTSCIPGDGAAGCVVTTEKKAFELGLKPLLRIIGWDRAGVDPVLMGIGPMESTARMFNRPRTGRAEGITMDDIDIIEIHEAFASQVLSVFKESESRYGIRWNREKINTYGGSIAYTHPLGATNFRLVCNILSRMDEDPSARYALAGSCAGGGLGMSVLFERYR